MFVMKDILVSAVFSNISLCQCFPFAVNGQMH